PAVSSAGRCPHHAAQPPADWVAVFGGADGVVEVEPLVVLVVVFVVDALLADVWDEDGGADFLGLGGGGGGSAALGVPITLTLPFGPTTRCAGLPAGIMPSCLARCASDCGESCWATRCCNWPTCTCSWLVVLLACSSL